MCKNQSYSFKALIFSGDRLVDSLEFETKETTKVLNEKTMKTLFEKLYKKYFPLDKLEELVNYSFNDNMFTNFSKELCQLSREVSYDVKSDSKLFSEFELEDLNINISLEYFYN